MTNFVQFFLEHPVHLHSPKMLAIIMFVL